MVDIRPRDVFRISAGLGHWKNRQLAGRTKTETGAARRNSIERRG
jgi:hypothetical protein